MARLLRTPERLLLAALLVSLVAVVTGFAVSARADGPVRVVIVDEGSPELARKLRAEATHVGFAVIDPSSDSPGDDATLAQRHDAVAVLRVRSTQQVDLHVAANPSAGAQAQSFFRSDTESGEFPLRIAERVRALLVELRLWEPEKETAAPGSTSVPPSRTTTEPAPTAVTPPAPTLGGPSAAAPAPVAARLRPPPTTQPRSDFFRVWLHAGFGVSLSEGGVGPTGQEAVGARFEPDADWAAGAVALVPLTDGEIRAEAGEADINVNLIAAHLDYAPRLNGRFFAAIGFGAGVVLLAGRGEAEEPFRARTDRTATGAYFLNTGFGLWLTDNFRLRTTFLGGTVAPRPVFRFAGEEVARWGRLLGAGALEAEVGLPFLTEAGR